MAGYENIEKSHGRIEMRRIKTAVLPSAYLGWNGVRQVFEIERVREKNSKISKEIVYGITSLAQEIAPAEKLLHYVT